MAWYVAHAILSLEHLEEPRDRFLVWENLLIIEAVDSEQAWEAAERRAAQDATPEGSDFLPDGRPATLFDGRPARWRYVGVRKVVSVSHDTEDGVLHSGDEVSYNEFEMTSIGQVEALARGEEIVVRRTAVGYPDEPGE
jgi:hypothetical protein